MELSVGLWKSTKKTNLKHNNRKQNEYENNLIDVSRESENKYLIQKDIRSLYTVEFEKSLDNYNAKQKRKDRKIKNYYNHVCKSKKTSPQQEMILQIGEGDDYEFGSEKWLIANEILERYVESFSERNPNLKVYNAVIHNDETTPHLHLNFVPVAEGYKRGLDKQVAFDRAIKQQSQEFDVTRPFDVWRDNEVNVMVEFMKEYGIKRKLVGTNEIKDTNELKRITAEREKLAKERELLEKEKKAFVENQIKNIEPVASVKLTYSHKEKAVEKYEEVEPSLLGKFGIEKVVVKEREIETENYVMSPSQLKKVNGVLEDYKHLGSEYERLKGLLSDEVVLRKEQEQNHQKVVETLNKEINERAERLKDDKFTQLKNELGEVQKGFNILNNDNNVLDNDNKELKNQLQSEKKYYEELQDDYRELHFEHEDVKKERDKWKYKFEKLWAVTKEYLKEYSRDGIETVKSWFVEDTGEEIEPKQKKKKEKIKSYDIEL